MNEKSLKPQHSDLLRELCSQLNVYHYHRDLESQNLAKYNELSQQLCQVDPQFEALQARLLVKLNQSKPQDKVMSSEQNQF